MRTKIAQRSEKNEMIQTAFLFRGSCYEQILMVFDLTTDFFHFLMALELDKMIVYLHVKHVWLQDFDSTGKSWLGT